MAAKARTRAVLFRVTLEEFTHLKALSAASGSRSISDFARSQILRATGEPSLSQLEGKLDEIQSIVQNLTKSLSE